MPNSAFTAAFEQAPLAMVLVEAKTPFRAIVANAAFLRDVAGGSSLDRAQRFGLRDVLAVDERESTLSMLARVAGDRTARSCLEYRATDRRYWEVRASPVDHEGSPALLYVGSDVTARERERRGLERASDRLAELTAFTAAGLLNPERLTDALVDTAASVSHGFAAVYVGAAAEPLRRVAARGLRADHREIMPETLTPGRFRLVRSVLTNGGSRVFPYSPALPSDERTLLRGMHWLAIVPIRTRDRSIGVLVAVARGAATGLPRDDIRLLEWCAEQLGFAIEHGELFRGIDHERAELAVVLEQIPDAVVITDPDGRIVRENPAARQLFERADTADPAAATASPDGAGLGALPGTLGDLGITRALAGETVRGALGVVGGGRAEATWVVSSAAPLRAADGSLTGAVAVATDVTQHRRVEESLRVLAETSAVLASSLDYHGTLPTVAQLLVPRIADVCAIDVVEDGSATRIAFACDESIGESVRALRDVPLPEATVAAGGGARLVEQVAATALGALAADVRQLDSLRALGLRSSVVAPIAARGRHCGVLWLATAQSFRRYDASTLALAEDLARRVAAAIDNALLYQAAQEADRRKDEFLAMLSHELRTPLAPIMAWMQILRRAGDPEHVKAAVDAVERNVRLQTALIDDLLDLTAITRGKVHLESTPQDFRAIVETAVETVRMTMSEKAIVLACEVPDESVVVEGDANRLQQVVWNLLTNAIKFSGENAPVQVSLERHDDAAVLRVRDRGAGIAPEFLPHVFDMFRQQERGARRSYGGLGIGLAIAKRITELHRGTIEVHSDGVGRGAEFCVRLPVAPSPPVHAGEPAMAFRSLPVGAVLLVEDVPDTREAAHALLEEMGVRVIEAAEGVEALAMLERHPVDLVLCDLRMPLMDGFELIRRIREHPRHRDLPVIAVSGYATEDDEQRTRDAGFDGYVRKPFVESTLAAAVDRVLQQRRPEPRSSTG